MIQPALGEAKGGPTLLKEAPAMRARIHQDSVFEIFRDTCDHAIAAVGIIIMVLTIIIIY
jgi:hypothetical protein